MDQFRARVALADQRVKAATDRYNSIMNQARTRLDAISQATSERRMDIIAKYTEKMKQVIEFSKQIG